MSFPKPPSCLESTRASLTASNSACASNIHRGSGRRELIPSGHRVPNQSGGLFPQDGYLPIKPSMRSPNPPSCLERARDFLSASNSNRSNKSHSDIGGGGVSPRGRRVPNRSRGLFPLDGSPHFKSSVRYPNPSYFSDSAWKNTGIVYGTRVMYD